MSNKRINLKQFEGIGEWKVLAHRHNKVIDWQVKTGRNMRSKEEAETIAKLPTLIAELKKCYAREDKLKARVEESIEALDGVDSLFSEEVVQLLREIASE